MVILLFHSLLNEIYCAARRMYRATSVTSNNVASALSAVSTPILNKAAQIALPDLANVSIFLIGHPSTIDVLLHIRRLEFHC